MPLANSPARVASRIALVAALVVPAAAAAVQEQTSSGDDDLALVRAHVAKAANATFREPSGKLRFKYLVPAGPYNEM